MDSVSAEAVISATGTLKSNVESLSSSFTENMIAKSDGVTMEEVGDKICQQTEQFVQIIDDAAQNIANEANTYSPGGEA